MFLVEKMPKDTTTAAEETLGNKCILNLDFYIIYNSKALNLFGDYTYSFFFFTYLHYFNTLEIYQFIFI